jgi:hypothetical protein
MTAKPLPSNSKPSMFWCRSCGMVRESDVAPWCRHNDPALVIAARRMVPLPVYHPLAKEKP